MNIHDFLIQKNACFPAIEWAHAKTMDEIWNTCERGDWLLWLAEKCEVDIRTLTAAKAECAALGMPYVTDQRSINAIEAARKFGSGEMSDEALKVYASYAHFAVDDAYDSKEWVTYAAAYCSYSASSISTPAFHAASCDFSGSDEMRDKLSRKCADIVRGIIQFDHIKQFINNY